MPVHHAVAHLGAQPSSYDLGLSPCWPCGKLKSHDFECWWASGQNSKHDNEIETISNGYCEWNINNGNMQVNPSAMPTTIVCTRDNCCSFHSAGTLMQYFVLLLNGSKCNLKYIFQAIYVLAILNPGTRH